MNLNGFIITDPTFMNKIFASVQSKKFSARKGMIKISDLTFSWNSANQLKIPDEMHEDLLLLLEYFDVCVLLLYYLSTFGCLSNLFSF
jgi:hypothetical protein